MHRWLPIVLAILLAGCASSAPGPTSPATATPATPTPAPSAPHADGFVVHAVDVDWGGASVAAPAGYDGLGGGELRERIVPGNPFGAKNWPIIGGPTWGTPAASLAASRSQFDTIFLPAWTVDGQTGAIVVHDSPTTPSPSATLARASDASELPLDRHAFACETSSYGSCDLAQRTFHLEPQAPGDGSASHDHCLGGFIRMPDADLMHFPLESGKSWSSDATGLFGLPIHQDVQVLGLATSDAWNGTAVHLRSHQSVIETWVRCVVEPLWDESFATFDLRMNATVDTYYLPAAAHVVLRHVNATYTLDSAPTGGKTLHQNGTVLVEDEWHPYHGIAAGDAYGDYEKTLAFLNQGAKLAPTGAYMRFDVAIEPKVVLLKPGDPDPTFAATWHSDTWPSTRLPSGASWRWAVADGKYPAAQTGTEASFTPHVHGPGTFVLSAALGWGSYASATIGEDATGSFDPACGTPTNLPFGSTACGATTFPWTGAMDHLLVFGTITSQAAQGGRVTVTAPNGYQWAADADANGKVSLRVSLASMYSYVPAGNWTIDWTAPSYTANGETAHVDFHAYPLIPKPS